MKTLYDHDQTAWAILGVLAAILTIFPVTYFAIGEQTESLPILGGSIAILFLIGLLFYKGSTRVTIENVQFSFGPGLISKTIKLSEIESLKPVRNSFWNGFGIRFTGRSWLYNVSGYEAVEFSLSTGKTIRFGTDEPDRLIAAVRRALSKNKETRA